MPLGFPSPAVGLGPIPAQQASTQTQTYQQQDYFQNQYAVVKNLQRMMAHNP
jgi:hypothetical protein